MKSIYNKNDWPYNVQIFTKIVVSNEGVERKKQHEAICKRMD